MSFFILYLVFIILMGLSAIFTVCSYIAKPDLKVKDIESSTTGDLIITLEDGRKFRGSHKRWYTYPSCHLCDSNMCSALYDIWKTI